MTKTTLNPYLFFGGRCEEATEFYRTAIDAKLEMMMRFNESPEPMPPGMLQQGFESKIMRASLDVSGNRLMLSDGCDDLTKMQGFRLVLSFDEEAAARKHFDALACEGQIDMPLTKTFWSPCYGMVTDRFQVAWMVMVPAEMQ